MLSLKNDVKNEYYKLGKKTNFCWHLERPCQKKQDPELNPDPLSRVKIQGSGFGFVKKSHGSRAL